MRVELLKVTATARFLSVISQNGTNQMAHRNFQIGIKADNGASQVGYPPVNFDHPNLSSRNCHAARRRGLCCY